MPYCVVEADVEPHRRVEGAVLVEAQPGQVVVEDLRLRLVREIPVLDAPVGDGAGHAVHQLPDGCLAPALGRVGAVRDVAIEIFRHRDLGRQLAPRLGHLDVLLLENRLADIIGDRRRPQIPFDLVKRRNPRQQKHLLEGEPVSPGFLIRPGVGPIDGFTLNFPWHRCGGRRKWWHHGRLVWLLFLFP